MQPGRYFRYFVLRFQRLRGDPKRLALGVAIGCAIGITPTIPFHILFIAIACLGARASIMAGILASVIVSNPLTFFLQYYFSWKVGVFLLPTDVSWTDVQKGLETVWQDNGFREGIAALMRLGGDVLVRMLAGGVLLGIPFGLAGYFLSLPLFRRMQAARNDAKK